MFASEWHRDCYFKVFFYIKIIFFNFKKLFLRSANKNNLKHIKNQLKINFYRKPHS